MKVFLERLWQDLYHGSRMLAKNPAFTVVAVISLAIGIGANCAMYSWADALLLRPLPVARPGDVISVGTKVSLAGFSSLVNSYPDFQNLRDRTRSFDNLTAFTSLTVGLTDKPDAVAQMKFGMLVTSNLFAAMGVEPGGAHEWLVRPAPKWYSPFPRAAVRLAVPGRRSAVSLCPTTQRASPHSSPAAGHPRLPDR